MWESIFRTVFLRIISLLPVGLVAWIVIRVHIESLVENGQNFLSVVLNNYYLLNSYLNSYLIFIPFLLLLGEIYAMVGEIIINPLFDYCPLVVKKDVVKKEENENYNLLMEKISPFSSEKLYYSDIDKNIAFEMAEVHFSISRIFAALGAICLSYFGPYLPFLLAILLSIYVFILRYRVLFVIFLFLFFLIFENLGCPLITNKSLSKDFCAVFILMLFFFISSIYYRSR